MKKVLIVITVLLVSLAGYLAFNFYSLEKEFQGTHEVVLGKVGTGEKKVEIVKGYYYIPNKSFSKLEKEEAEYEYSAEKNVVVNMVVSKISQEMKSNGMLSQELKLMNSYFNGQDLYLNFKINEIFSENSNKTIYLVYSITNSLTELGGIERIKILVDNEEKKGVLEGYFQRNLNI